MLTPNYTLVYGTPTSEAYRLLRVAAGLRRKSAEAARSLPNQLFAVIVQHQSRLIGVGRVIIDGSTTFQVVVSLLLALAASLHAQQRTDSLRIRILNARTGQPIADERLNVALAANQIGSVALPTDKTGTIVLDLTRPENRARTTLRILSNMYADCRPRAELYTDYPIATILRSGITTGNLCSTAHPAPTPGQILLYEIPRTFIPTAPNGPSTTLPHSDENPNLTRPPAR